MADEEYFPGISNREVLWQKVLTPFSPDTAAMKAG
jgi:hypothetical protein